MTILTNGSAGPAAPANGRAGWDWVGADTVYEAINWIFVSEKNEIEREYFARLSIARPKNQLSLPTN